VLRTPFNHSSSLYLQPVQSPWLYGQPLSMIYWMGIPHVILPHLTSHCMRAWPSGCCGCESQQWAGPDAGALPPTSCAPAACAHTVWGRSRPCLQSSHMIKTLS
jgi:hypothetical protein